MELSAPLEDYLETIYQIVLSGGQPTVTEIARRLNVKKPSVTRALGSLREAGLIQHEPYRRIRMTPQGREMGRRILGRHHLLHRFLTEFLGIDPETAERDACRMEHSLSPQTRTHLALFVTCLDEEGQQLVEAFQRRLPAGG